PPNTLRFPHGLMLFGETVEECAQRLIGDQLGLELKEATVLSIDSYVDEQNHWHLEPLILAEVEGTPALPVKARQIVTFNITQQPGLTYWPDSSLRETLQQYAPDVLSRIKGFSDQ